MTFIKQFLFAFLSTMGFAILFSIPKDCIIKSGIIGALGWIVYINTYNLFSSPVAGTFLGALTVGIVGEIFAKHFKKPATVFIIPGIIPLVPGAGMYYTMLAVVEKRFEDSANLGTETFFIAAAVATGIIISSSISRVIRRIKQKN